MACEIERTLTDGGPALQTPRTGRKLRRLVAGALMLGATLEVRAQDHASSIGEGSRTDELGQLERQVALAEADVFYLMLDPVAPALTLRFGGATLETYDVTTLEVRTPRVVFADVGPDSDEIDWVSTVWNAGTLVPPRPVTERRVQPPAPGATEDPALDIPATADVAIPVPDRYRIRFTGGFALEVVPSDDAAAAAGEGWASSALNRWQDLRSVLVAADRDAVRVRLALAPGAADALYRALPPDVRLLILPVLASPTGETSSP